jgi:hypothetical protein
MAGKAIDTELHNMNEELDASRVAASIHRPCAAPNEHVPVDEGETGEFRLSAAILHLPCHRGGMSPIS